MSVHDDQIAEVLEKARSLAAVGQIDQAGEVLHKAAVDHPESTELLTHLGAFYHRIGRNNLALLTFQKRNTLAPPDFGVCRILSEIHEKRGEYHIACTWLNHALQIQDNQSLRERLHHLQKLSRHQSNRGQTKRLLNIVSVFSKGKAFLKRLNNYLVFCMETLLPHWSMPEQGRSSFKLSSYLAFALRYDFTFRAEGIAYHKTREIILASRHLPIDQPHALILDLGTGKNSLPLYWSSLGASVIVLDGSMYGFSCLQQVEREMETAQIKRDISYISGDMRLLPFQSDSIDAISALCAIEHLPGDGDVDTLNEIHRVLKPGGTAIITVETNQKHFETWLEVPYEIGYQIQGSHEENQNWQEVFCRNYSPETMISRLAPSASWQIFESGFYDDSRYPFRRRLDPYHQNTVSSILRQFQPFLSLLFFRVTQPKNLSPSSIGYLILRKPL